ncbi:MAG: rRNA maturation RNase YbeY [Gammaproteobacteria bacterium]|nr:rRNA maturation RNase YbeY [Gammaproteobacteria bacterium]
MSISIDLQNDYAFTDIPDIEQFSLWVKTALEENLADIEQTIRIVDEAESRSLNQQYRGKDRATNILSFPSDIPHIDYLNLGDLVVCAPLVEREAFEQSKTVLAHWAHLIVHGMLHLQDLKHENEDEATKMEALEIEILSTLGYSNPYNNE